jgi:hypothetical protein
LTGKLDKVKTNPSGAEDKIVKRVSQMDTRLHYLALKEVDDRWIGLLGNYSMHYVGDWPNGTVTADYFGYFSRHIAAKLNADDAFVGMLSNGTSGDANIWDFLQPDRYPKEFFKKSELIGNDLATRVFEALQNTSWDADPVLACIYDEIAMPVCKPSSEELQAATEIVKTSDFENIEANEEGLKKLYAREQVLLNEYPDTVPFPLQAMKIGSCIIGALAGEFFAETGLWLRGKLKTTYFTITMANGYFGYVPPPHQIELGGYETWRCRTSFLHSEKEIREKLLTMIQKL